jgi:hypothetical protein
MGDFDMENWSALLPSFSPDGTIVLDRISGDYDIAFNQP